MTSISNWMVFLLINLLVFFSSGNLAGIFVRAPGMQALRLVATGIFCCAHATLVVLFLGVIAQQLTYLSVALFSGLLSTGLILLFHQHRQPLLQPAKQMLLGLMAERDWFLIAICALFLVQVLIMVAKIVWLPPHIWDVFAYHLPPAAIWHQQELIPALIESPVNRINGSPLGMTALAYWFFIFFRDDFLVEMPMFLWALLLTPLVYSALRAADLNRAWALKFSIVTFFVPIVLMQGVTVKDHLGLNISFIAALVFMAAFFKTHSYRLLIVAACALGLGLGYKIAAPLYLLVAAAMFFVFLLINQSFLLAPGRRIKMLHTAVAGGLTLGLIGGYWWLKNLLVFGTLTGAYDLPLNQQGLPPRHDWQGHAASILSSLSDHRLAAFLIAVALLSAASIFWHKKAIASVQIFAPKNTSRSWLQRMPKAVFIATPIVFAVALIVAWMTTPLAQIVSAPMAKATANAREFFPRIFDYLGVYGADLAQISGFGPQFAGFGLLAMLAVVAGAFNKNLRNQGSHWVALTALVLFIVLLFINHNPNGYRILSFLPMAMIPFAAVLLYQGGVLKPGSGKLTVNLMLLGSIIWSAALTLPPNYSNLRRFKEFVAMDAEFRTSANYTQWFSLKRPSLYRLLEHIPATEPIAYVSARMSITKNDERLDTWSYLYYDRHWQRRLTFLYLPLYFDCDNNNICRPKPALKQRLTSEGIQYLSSCKTNRCIEIDDPELVQIVPGLYRYRATQ